MSQPNSKLTTFDIEPLEYKVMITEETKQVLIGPFTPEKWLQSQLGIASYFMKKFGYKNPQDKDQNTWMDWNLFFEASCSAGRAKEAGMLREVINEKLREMEEKERKKDDSSQR